MKKILCFISVLSFTLVSNAFAEFQSLAPVLRDAMPSVVNIAVQGVISDPRNSNDDLEEFSPFIPIKPKKFQSIGSGVIFDANKGIIITNDHVIRHAQIITVTLNDGRRLKAKKIGGDGETDVAVLKIDAKNLRAIPMGDSDKLQVGDFVVAIGNPFGLNSFGNSQSATFGIVSALKRSDLNIEGIENFIQTDAAINPGNSGGALIDTKGQLVGMNTAILSPYGGNVGIGFAIPVNMIKEIVEQILKYGTIHRGLMGVYVQHLTPELSHAMGYDENLTGALVAQVNEGSPAEQAGVKAGDIIVSINNTPITEASQVKTAVSLLRVGTKVNIGVLRDKKKINIQVKVTDIKHHEQKMQAANPLLYGLALRNFEQNTPLQGEIKGVQVVGAAENSPGWRAGLRPGDIIISANRTRTLDVKSLQSIANKNSKQLLLQVLRGPGALYILVD